VIKLYTGFGTRYPMFSVHGVFYCLCVTRLGWLRVRDYEDYWVFLWVEVPIIMCSLPLLIYSPGGRALVRVLISLQVGSLVGFYVYLFYALSKAPQVGFVLG
jgi:hypothetical protein